MGMVKKINARAKMERGTRGERTAGPRGFGHEIKDDSTE